MAFFNRSDKRADAPAESAAPDPAGEATEAAEATIDWLRCRADWRRSDGYWRCSKKAGHRGRHRLAPEAGSPPSLSVAQEKRRVRRLLTTQRRQIVGIEEGAAAKSRDVGKLA